MPYTFCEQIGKEIRDISDEIPFEIPDSWEWARLSFVCQLIDGTKQNGKYNNLDVRYMRGKGEAKILESGKYVEKETKLILVDGENSGEVFIAPENGYMGSTFKVLWISECLKVEYVLKFIEMYRKPLRDSKKGSAIPHLNKEMFFSLLLPLPPLAEQKRIVEKIEQLLPFIEKYEQAETQLTTLNTSFPEMLKKSILQEAVQGKLVPQNSDDEPASVLLERIRAEKQKLIKAGKIKKSKHESVIITRDKIPYELIDGKERCIADEVPFEIPESWEWAYIGNIAFVTKLAGFEYTKNIAPNLQSSGIPLFKGKNVQNGRLVYNFEGYIPEPLSNELIRSQINKKCLLTPYVGSIGNIAIFPGDFKAHLGSNVGKIEIIQNLVIEEYVMYFFRSYAGYNELTKYKKATAQESISIEAIRNAFIPIPPLAEQKRIVEKIEELIPMINSMSK